MDLEIFGHLRRPPTQTPIFTPLKQRNDHSKIRYLFAENRKQIQCRRPDIGKRLN